MSIWNTAEAESWCRGFSYEEYVNKFCKSMEVKPLSVSAYIRVCAAFDQDNEDACRDTDGQD